MRRKSVIAVLAIAVILACASVSVAYFTSRDKASNVFTVGSVAIELEEPAWNPTEEHDIVPGASYAKDPTVKNSGTTEAYVRMCVRFSDHAAFASAAPDYDLASMLGGMGERWVRTAGPVVVDDEAIFWFCYRDVVPAGTATQPLFSQVTIPEFATSEFVGAAGGTFDITVTADAIQGDTFEDYEAAFAAFDTYA